MKPDERLDNTWWVLRWTFGLVPIVAGADKFFNLLTNWEQYLSPLAPRLTHIPATTFMHLVGVIEMAAGVLVFTRLTRWAAYIVAIWLVGIAMNLLTQGRYFDVAVRDIVMAISSFALARLTEVRAEAISLSEKPDTLKVGGRAIA